MKKVLLLVILSNICFAQIIDTLQFDVGKQDGFQRIRLLDNVGNIQKVWTTNWKKDGVCTKEYTEYSKKDIRKYKIDSTFDGKKRLIILERKIGDTIEGERYEFDKKGSLIRKDVSIQQNMDYVIFQKWFENEWTYLAIIDGNPPVRISISASEFIGAEKTLNSKAKKLGLSIIKIDE